MCISCLEGRHHCGALIHLVANLEAFFGWLGSKTFFFMTQRETNYYLGCCCGVGTSTVRRSLQRSMNKSHSTCYSVVSFDKVCWAILDLFGHASAWKCFGTKSLQAGLYVPFITGKMLLCQSRYGGISVGGVNSQVRLTETEITATFSDLKEIFNSSQVCNILHSESQLLSYCIYCVETSKPVQDKTRSISICNQACHYYIFCWTINCPCLFSVPCTESRMGWVMC